MIERRPFAPPMNRHRTGEDEPKSCRRSERSAGGNRRVSNQRHQAAGSRRESRDFEAGRLERVARLIRFRDADRRGVRPSLEDEAATGTVRTAKSPRSMNPIIKRMPILLPWKPWSRISSSPYVSTRFNPRERPAYSTEEGVRGALVKIDASQVIAPHMASQNTTGPA